MGDVIAPKMGIDLALGRTALVWRMSQTRPGSCVIETPKLRAHASDRERVERLGYVVREVVNAVRVAGAREAAIEGYAYGKAWGGGMVFSIAELGGAVRYALWHELGIIPLTINPMTARLLALGSGKLKKAEVVKRVQKLYRFDTDDEADAYVVLRALEIIRDGGVALTPAQERSRKHFIEDAGKSAA